MSADPHSTIIIRRNTCIQAELRCLRYGDKYYFEINYYWRGSAKLLARDWFELSTDGLAARAPDPLAWGKEIYWVADTHRIFGSAHRSLVTHARRSALKMPGCVRVMIRAQYIRVPDYNPFPRGFVNRFTKYAPRGAGTLPDLGL